MKVEADMFVEGGLVYRLINDVVREIQGAFPWTRQASHADDMRQIGNEQALGMIARFDGEYWGTTLEQYMLEPLKWHLNRFAMRGCSALTAGQKNVGQLAEQAFASVDIDGMEFADVLTPLRLLECEETAGAVHGRLAELALDYPDIALLIERVAFDEKPDAIGDMVGTNHADVRWRRERLIKRLRNDPVLRAIAEESLAVEEDDECAAMDATMGLAAVAFGTAFQSLLATPPRQHDVAPARRRRMPLLMRPSGTFRLSGRATRPPSPRWPQPVATREHVTCGSGVSSAVRVRPGPALFSSRARPAGLPAVGVATSSDQRAPAAWRSRAGPEPPLAIAA